MLTSGARPAAAGFRSLRVGSASSRRFLLNAGRWWIRKDSGHDREASEVIFGKTRACRQNVEWKHSGSYNFSVLCRNECVERLLPEATRGEVAHSLDAAAALRRNLRRTLPLGLERSERKLDDIRSKSTSLEIVANQRIAGAPLGELLRPRAGEALVVHTSDPLERL